MGLKKLWIVRHGQTDYNLQHIIQGSGVNPSLNCTGMEQAEAFYAAYRHINFELLVASSLRRTRETIRYFESREKPIYMTPLINEISWGMHEGKKFAPWMRDNYHNLMQAWGREQYDFSLPGGESATSLRRRLQTFVWALVRRPESNMLICTHGRTIRCLLTILREEPLKDMEKYEHNNTGLFKAEWDGEQFRILCLNDTSHLG